MFPIVFNKSKIKQVLILLPLHREGLTSYLSPLLGQYGIRNVDFINSFIEAFNVSTMNVYSADLSSEDLEAGLSDEELTVPVYLTVYKNGKYELRTGHSLVGSLFHITFKKRRRFYRKGFFYRNYKKLLQLTVFSKLISSVMDETLGKDLFYDLGDKSFEETYKQVRNSLHAKKNL